MKRTYNDYITDLNALYLRSDINYKDLQTFIEYAKTTDRFDNELGYSYKEVDNE